MAGQRLPGAFDDLGPDRGGVLFRDRRPMTPGLQKNNCLETDGDGYSLTLPAAAKGLSISFNNIGKFAVDVFAAPKPQWSFDPWAVDRIDGNDNATPFALAAGASVTFTAENYRWTTS
jgi:hypothetical protein